MRSREHQDWNRDLAPSHREWRERLSDEDSGEDRRYRGRESYEQQYRSGQGGMSDVWDRPTYPREMERDRPGRGSFGVRRNEWDQRYRGMEDRDRYDDPDYDWYRSRYGRQEEIGREQSRRGYEDEGSGRGMGMPGMSLDDGRFQSGGMSGYGSYGKRRSGNAPKGYRRSDDRIREDVCDRLSERWDVDARSIEVTVSNGEVTLSGTVPERTMKFRAESIADSIGGVSEVHNQLRITAQPQQGSEAGAQNRSEWGASSDPSLKSNTFRRS